MNDRLKPWPYIIAEAGVNHNGSLATAIAMVDAASQADVNAIKFQLFEPALLATHNVPMADYQVRHSANAENQASQLTMLKSLALSQQDHFELHQYCSEADIDYLCSPFDLQSAAFLTDRIKLPTIKIGSGEITNGPLLWQLANSNVDVILSTGMSSIEDIQCALGVLALGYKSEPIENLSIENIQQASQGKVNLDVLKSKVTLLHCTSEYPCPFEDINLLAMNSLAEIFSLPIGLSDHSEGISVSLAAVARGATVIEKHFTLNRNQPGPDHKASLIPEELTLLAKEARNVFSALGSSHKTPLQCELNTKQVARKHLVAATNIAKGEIFTTTNMTAKRCPAGLSPMTYWQVLGQSAVKNFKMDEAIEI